jgi:membrane-associated phospholipid phosphatase
VVLAVLVVTSILAGLVAAAGIRRWPRADPARATAGAIGEELEERRWSRGFLRSRVDPEVTTGLALTAAVGGLVVTGTLVGVIVYMVRRDSGIVDVDRSIARWAADHATDLTNRIAHALTQLGSTPAIILVALVAAAFTWKRRPSLAIPAFLTLIVGGQFLLSNLIKLTIDRVRPDVGSLAPLGTPSFPSGHATAAAATYAAVALLLGIARSPTIRSFLGGAAVAIAVAIGCTRVILGVHWFSDVIAGLALGWTWFGICAVAFGGHLLRFGAPVDDGTVDMRTSAHPEPARRE